MSISTANANIAVLNRYLFNATGGETSVSGVDANGNTLSYTVGKEEVYLNGVKLVSGTDYTATTGTSITGLTALVASDVVEVIAFGTFVVATAMGAAQTTPPSAPVEGLIWLDTDGQVPSYTLTRWSKSPSAGTTSLTGTDDSSNTLAYTAGYEKVYVNGTLLSRGNDYTASDGTTITLTTATVAGDVVEVFSQSAYSYSDSIAKAAYTTTGDILYASSANTPARLGIGSSSQVLTVSGGVPTWAAPVISGMTLISTTTFSGVSITLSSIPTTYNDLRVVIRQPSQVADGNNLLFRFMADSTANRHAYGTSNTSFNSGGAAQTWGNNQIILDEGGDNTAVNGLVIMDFPDYANTSTWKMMRWTALLNDYTTTTSYRLQNGIGIYNQTDALTSLQFFFDSTNADGGSILLYGVK